MASEISSKQPQQQQQSLDLVNKFDLNFTISKPIENDTIRPHPKFSDNYSDSVRNIQNKRRLEFLENLKRKRQEIFDKMRNLIEEDIFDEKQMEQSCDNTKCDIFNENKLATKPNDSKNEMEIDDDCSKKDIKKSSSSSMNRYQKYRKDYRKLIADKFMLSEWLVDIPEDFFTNWYMLCCPKGRRTLVVASNNRTKVYARNGYFLFQFQSSIPGGGRLTSSSQHQNLMNKNSMLDCIWIESEQTFYILDVIIWNGCTFYDCDTEFRFYWMHNNIGEDLKNNKSSVSSNSNNVVNNDIEMCDLNNNDSQKSKLLSPSSNFRYEFKPLPYWPCTMDNIKLRAKGPYPFKVAIDGILFYHKQAPYTAGITPLVCWLKLNMIPKLFNFSSC